MTKNNDQPDCTHPFYDRMAPLWQLCRDLREGTKKIQEAGQRYLPKHPAEDDDDYKRRSTSTEVYDGFSRTIIASVGLVFQRPPTLGDKAGEVLEEHWENIDGAGNAGPVFLARAFDDALTTGLGGILVDYPRASGVETLADEQERKLKPYWVYYAAEDVISWRTAMRDGQLVLTQLVLRETLERSLGEFGSTHQCRFRVFRRPMRPAVAGEPVQREEVGDLVLWEVWDDASEGKGEKYSITSSGTVDRQKQIPFATMITGSHAGAIWGARPPLLNLAEMNLAHYRVLADRRHLIHLGCVPVPVRIGLAGRTENSAAPVPIGCNVLIDLPADGDFKWAEITGAAYEPSKADLDDLERRMGSAGLSFLHSETRSAETAEAKRIDSTAQNASLARAAGGLKDCVDNALSFHAAYLGDDDTEAEAMINTEFEAIVMEPGMIDSLSRLEANGQLDLDTLLQQLQRGRAIPEDRKIEDIKKGIMLRQGPTPTLPAEKTDDDLKDPDDPEKQKEKPAA